MTRAAAEHRKKPRRAEPFSGPGVVLENRRAERPADDREECTGLSRLFSIIAFIVSAALPAAAVEVRFVTSSQSGDLNDALSNASLLMQLNGDTEKSAQEVVAAAQADYSRLVGVLYERGFFGPTVSILVDGREAADIPAVRNADRVGSAVIRVEPGPLFRFGEARIGPLAPGTDLPEEFRSGAAASTGAMRDAVDAGITRWREVGHAKAELAEQSIIARHPVTRVDTVLRIAPNQRLTFGRLRIEGDTDVRAERIREIAAIPSGDVFHPDAIDRATTRLRRTGAFRVAALSEAETANPDGSLDIEAQIVSEEPRRLGFGAEISSLEGLGLSAFWLHRNLRGGAERLRFDAEVSGIGGTNGGPDVTVSANFSRPATFSADTDLYIKAEVEVLDEDTYNARSVNLETGLRYYASEHREYSLGIGLQGARTQDVFGTRTYTLLTLPGTALRDYRDNDLDPREGYYAQLELTPFVSLQNAADGVRTQLDLRGYKSFGAEDNVTLAARGQLGSLVGPTLAQAPADSLFYSGGGGTVRGHEFESLGVDLGGGLITGGRSFMAFSGEVRVRTSDKLGFVGFYDVGYVGPEQFPDGSTGRWHSGAGIGARYDVGIGPIRVDLAVPLTGPGSNSGFDIYVGIGQAF